MRTRISESPAFKTSSGIPSGPADVFHLPDTILHLCQAGCCCQFLLYWLLMESVKVKNLHLKSLFRRSSSAFLFTVASSFSMVSHLWSRVEVGSHSWSIYYFVAPKKPLVSSDSARCWISRSFLHHPCFFRSLTSGVGTMACALAWAEIHSGAALLFYIHSFSFFFHF